MSDFEDDVLNSDGDLDYEVCEEDEEALLADDQGSKNSQVVDARERILQRSLSKTEDDWEEEEDDDDNEGRGRFLSERAPNIQAARPREDIPDTLDQVEVPENENVNNNNRRPLNFQNRGRGGRRGGRFFHRGGFRGRGRGGFGMNGNLRSLGDDGMRFQEHPPPLLNAPSSAPTKILINPHFKGPRPLLSTPSHYPEPEEPHRKFPPPLVNNPPPPGPGYQPYNPPLLPPPPQYHEPQRPYLDQPPPYNPPPQHRPPPPQDWGQPEPYFPNRQHGQHPQDFLPPHRPPPQRPPLLQGPPPQQQPPYPGPPPHRGPFPGPPQHRPLPPQQYPPAPYQQPPPHQPPPYSQPPPLQQYQPPPSQLNYPPPPSGQPPYQMQGQMPPMGHQPPYYDDYSGPPPPVYAAQPTLLPPPMKEDFRPSIFLTERLERRRSRSRSPYYDRYRRRSRSRSRSYSPPRRYRDDLRRPPARRLTPEPIRKPASRQYSPPPPIRKRESSPPPRKPANPEETAYLQAIEKQKQERETVLKMKAIKRKLEIEKKKRDGDNVVASPEKKSPAVPSSAAAGPSREPTKVNIFPQDNANEAAKVILKPKIKVIKKVDRDDLPVRKISLVTRNPAIDEPLVSRALSKNGEDSSVRRIFTTKKDVAGKTVLSVLRGAEGPSLDDQLSNKMIKKSVIITKPASQAGLAKVPENHVSLVSSNKQMRLAITKSAKQVIAGGVTVAVENISLATTTETLKKMGLGMGLKAIKMKKAGSQQMAHMIFANREGAEKFVMSNQRKLLDNAVIDLKVL
ncbi:uncharacterized protein LOC132193900 [Neocloeon triangulifer]|uniref:uncharacterized protein LOC132193900 n=1 Tax=Neocloeon triangulifer TaxID=2078957 RepID=UPI00286EF0C9|nr:uncharacterized protein LOC132193900 [Neocloeon triangulifer]